MSPIIKLLQEMRGRVPMYVGTNSLVQLAYFLRGYEHACKQLGAARDDHFLSDFRDWIRRRFSVSISKSWDDIISFQTADENEAMEYFWELLDEYLQQKANEPSS